MTAQAAARNIVQMDGPDWIGPVGIKSGATIYHGAMVALNTSGIQLAAATAALTAPIGVADLQAWDDNPRSGQATVFNETTGQSITNSGADGARRCIVRQGCFKMKNKAGDLVTLAHIGLPVYVEDDQTVKATAAGAPAAGKLVRFDDDGAPIVAVGIGASYGRM